jgi:hypothetical protein
MIPLEMCTVLKGQFVRRDVVVPQEQVERVLEFATKKPKERLNAITTGVEVTRYIPLRQAETYIFFRNYNLRRRIISPSLECPSVVNRCKLGRALLSRPT